jgi:peptidoglycan/xylan/chitin deacetylase (PgdA/CDA1 family)
VALTIDDGPVKQTAEVLDLFKKYDVKATFFVLGQNAKKYPELLKRMVEEGHEIGNHSWNHPQFDNMTAAQINKQLDDTDKVIEKATGIKPVLVRTPYGQGMLDSEKRVRQVLKKRGNPLILWSIDPNDWKASTSATASCIVGGARKGSIILTHDTGAETRAAYPTIIKKLQKKGFKFVTISQMLGDNLKAGKRYSGKGSTDCNR